MNESTHSLSGKLLGAGMVANILEWYDFGLFGFLAPLIGAHFFPSSNPIASLLGAYGGFAIGFAMRPIGAAILGHIGDRVGRRTVMIVSVVLMGAATTLIGLLPTYREIGVWAPILLVAVRLFQGLSVGGEFTGSVTYLIETAPPNRRGLAGSVTNIGSEVGYLLASGLAAATFLLLRHHAVDPWIWRLPFLGGGVLAILSYWAAHHLPESYEPDRSTGVPHMLPLKQVFRDAPRTLVVVTAFTWGFGVVDYLALVFLPAYASKFGRIDVGDALAINAAMQGAALVLIPFAGWFTDRFIRRRTMLILVWSVFAVTAIALFRMSGRPELWQFAVAQGSMIAFLLLTMGTAPAMLAELFPARFRVSGYSVAYNIGFGIGGGTAPLIATALIGAFGGSAGASFLFGGTVLSLGALCLMHDRSREPLW